MKTLALHLLNKHQEKILLSADQAIVSASNFVIGIFISMVLGLHDLGIYALTWIVLHMISSLLQNFITIPMVNYYVVSTTDQDQYLTRIFTIQFFTTLLLIFILVLAIYFLDQIYFFASLGSLGNVLPILLFSYIMQDFMRRVYSLRNNLWSMFIMDLMVNGFQVVFLFFIQGRYVVGLSHILYAFSFTYFLGFVVSAVGTFRAFRIDKHIAEIIVMHWKNARWLIATALIQWFAGNYFIISAGTIMGAEAVGTIRIAQSVVGVLNIFFIALEFYVPPRAVLLYNTQGKKALIRYSYYILGLGLLFCSFFTLLLLSVGEQFLISFYGTIYSSYHSTVVVFSLFYIVVFIGFPLRFVLRAMNRTKDMFIGYVLATIFSLTTANYMIHMWGITGVIIGLLVAQLIMQGWYLRAILKTE